MFVYAMRGGGYAKVGVSDDIEKRLTSFNRGALPFALTIICLGETGTRQALEIEAAVLDVMPGRLAGEWFDGATPDTEIVTAFQQWKWTRPLLVHPTADEVAAVNRASHMQRQLEASRAIARSMETKVPAGVDWHRIATELSIRGDKRSVMKVKKAYKAKRLAEQRRVAK